MHSKLQFDVTLGRYRNLCEIENAFAESNCFVHPRAEPLLRETAANFKYGLRFKIVVVAVEDIGFPDGGDMQSVFLGAARYDIGICRAEVAPQLRLQYLNQKGGELLYIAMRPIKNQYGSPMIFVLTKGFGGPLLYCDFAYHYTHLHPKDLVAFVK